MNISENELKPPKKNLEDTSYEVTKFLGSRIPVIGKTIGDLFDILITPPIERRRDEWRNKVSETLKELIDIRQIDLKNLSDNESFIDTVLHTSLIAVRTSQTEKKTALRNAISNAAINPSLDITQIELFLHWIDIFTVWHLKILKFFQSPIQWYMQNDKHFTERESGSLNVILITAFPELKDKSTVYNQIFKDLITYGLIGEIKLGAMISENGLKEKRSTDLGDEFLKFIEEPTSKV